MPSKKPVVALYARGTPPVPRVGTNSPFRALPREEQARIVQEGIRELIEFHRNLTTTKQENDHAAS